jgi:hypothetical protein
MDEHVHLVLLFCGDAILGQARGMSALTYPEAIVVGALQGVTDLFPASGLGDSVIVANGLRLHRWTGCRQRADRRPVIRWFRREALRRIRLRARHFELTEPATGTAPAGMVGSVTPTLVSGPARSADALTQSPAL